MAIDKKIIPPSEDYAPVPPVVEAGGGSQAPEERQQEGAGEQEQEREQRPVSPYRDEPSQSYEGAPPSYGCVPASNAHANSTATGIAERDIESDPDEGQLPTSKQARRQRRRKICWRFTRAFVWALGFWFVIRLFVDGVRWIDDSGHIQAGWRDWPNAPKPPSSDGKPLYSGWSPTEPVPAHVDPTDTSNLELHRSFLQFTLSADASVLFVHGTGGEDRGLVKVVEVEAEAEGGKKEKREVKVEVEARFTDEGLRDAFSVVKMVHDSEEGVGIYSPTLLKTPSRDYLAFYVTVYIPAGRIEEFGVDVHNMAIKTAALDKIEFGAFDASSKNGHVEAKSLLATERIVLSSSNGHISSSSLLRAPSILASSRNGALTFSTLRSTTQTTLEALNGHISVSDLRSPLGTVDTKSGAVQGVYRVGKQLDLRTETGSIQADIYIEPTDDFELDVERPAHKHENEEQTDVRTFSVSATTRTGSVNLHYQSQPAHGVSLHSEAHSQTGSVSVTHARAYSGTFQLGSNVGSTEARRPESDVEDPAGERRERKWVIEKSRGGWGAGWTGSEGIGSTVEGKVWWEGRSGSDEREWGYSHMSARTGSVHAMFD